MKSLSTLLPRRGCHVTFVALLGLLMGPSPAPAGNGRFRNGVFDFCVSVRFNATTTQLQQIRAAFQNGSQVLADATDGQHRFCTIKIVNDSGASESAEYWIMPEKGCAYATFGDYGVRGSHVTLFFESNFQGSDADGDAYTIAHEHAHHAYNVRDEYSGPPVPGCQTVSGRTTCMAECAAPPPPADSDALTFCLMDNYFTRGGNSGGGSVYTLNEFCVAANHDLPNPMGIGADNTFQQMFHHQSCWQTIAIHPRRPATLPQGLPVGGAPAQHTVMFREGFPNLRVMLVLDRSGSMADERRMEFAQLGANQFVDFIRDDDALGIVSFDHVIQVNFPLTTITSASQRMAAKAAINTLFPRGSTDIGDALLAARNQIAAQAQRSCNEIILLLTDGDHNTGTEPSAVIPALQDEGITVLAVGVGTSISTDGEMTLQTLASQTGGRYFRAANSFDLTALFDQLAAESTGSGLLLARAPGVIGSGQSREVLIPLEAGARSVTFSLTFANSADQLSLSLRLPSGGTVTPATTGPGIEFISGPNSQAFRVQNPEAGLWTLVVTAGNVTTGNFKVTAFAEHAGVQLTVVVTPEIVTAPTPADIHATPTFGGENVVGATVDGVVLRPDGSQVPVTLFDEGLPEHADHVQGDGVYSTRFNQYTSEGTYTFELSVVNLNGVTYEGEPLFASVGAPPNTKPVPPFTRMGSTTVIVLRPPTLAVHVDIRPRSCPNPFNPKSQGSLPVAILGTAAFNVSDIDPSSVRLAGVVPLRGPKIADETAPPVPGEDCTTAGPDGFPDLKLKFDNQEIARMLGAVKRGDRVMLTLSGNLRDGTPIEGGDILVIR